jgi:glycosyltransferase involved in cell wall biosynthesis
LPVDSTTALKRIALVLKGYPRLSETFIAQEILELERRGFDIAIHSLRKPYDSDTHPIHREISASVNYLPEYLHKQPLRVIKALLAGLFSARFWRVFGTFLIDLAHDPTRNRIRRFGQALVLRQDLAPDREWIYAHFMHTPASVAGYASTLTGLPWSISAHAKDIWTLGTREKRIKLASSQWLVTCTRANYLHLRDIAPSPDKVHLLYHGIDLRRFPDPGVRERTDETIAIVSVGRLVEKKGYRYLLQALAELPAHLRWHFTHIGGGTLQRDLETLAEKLGLSDKISWLGAQPQQRVLEQYRESDIFVLPSIIGDDGDRDGLPNVLMEAQSQRLACLSTDISGIPELIDHGVSGWLVEEKNSDALRDGLARLIDDDNFRRQLADAGFGRLHRDFSHLSCIEQLHQLLAPPQADQ